MTIKVYISGICGSHEVRKHQQRVLFILQSLPIDLQIVDITEPGRDEDLIFMQDEAKKHDKKTQLPPQIFNGTEYCGDYADFELANDDDEIMKFLKLEESSSKSDNVKETITQNGINHTTEQESLDPVEEINLNNVDENISLNDQEIISNNLESNIEAEKETVIETAQSEDTDIAVQDISENSASEDKKAEASEEESEEESD